MSCKIIPIGKIYYKLTHTLVIRVLGNQIDFEGSSSKLLALLDSKNPSLSCFCKPFQSEAINRSRDSRSFISFRASVRRNSSNDLNYRVPLYKMDTMSYNFTNCTDEAKSIFTTANDSSSTCSGATVTSAASVSRLIVFYLLLLRKTSLLLSLVINKTINRKHARFSDVSSLCSIIN